MVSLINLPTYQPSPLLDLSPITNAITQNRREALQQSQLQLSRDQFSEGQRQFDASFGLQKAADARAAQLAPLTRAQTEASTKATLAGIGQAERLALLQHDLEKRMLTAKTDAEIAGLKRRAEALGLTLPGQQPAQAATVPVGSTEAVPEQPPTPASAAPAQQGQAPADPYTKLVNPAIPPAAEEASRKQRAATAIVMGDPKDASKILTKSEDPKEYQTKDALWAERMARAEVTMRGNIGPPSDPTYNPGKKSNAFWPDDGILGMANSEQWKTYQAGAREWIAALLRKDTGAAVTDAEWRLYFPTYFPQPGDSKEVQQQKLERRVAEAAKLRASSGGFFERMAPGFDQEMTQRMREQDAARTKGKAPAAPAGPRVSPAAVPADAPRPANKQEFDSLPPGTIFIDPEGNPRRKG